MICILICLVKGCTSSKEPTMSTESVPVTTTYPTKEILLISPTTEISVTTVPPTTIVAVSSTPTPIVADNPSVNKLKFTRNYLINNVHNCEMQEIFSTYAKVPLYGLSQNPPKISAMSEGQFTVFIRDYTDGKNQNSNVIGISDCASVPVTPYWNFVEISAKVTPTNANPINYTVSVNVKSKGRVVAQFKSRVVAQFKTTEQLTLGRMIKF